MSDDVVVEKVVPVVAKAITSATYPDGDTALLELSTSACEGLKKHLDDTRRDVEAQVRSLSRDAAPDVDGWIARANQVQADIQQSKATARAIIEQAEAHAELQHSTEESSQKVGLLEKELAFSRGLEAALKEIQRTSSQLLEAKEELVHQRIKRAATLLQSAHTNLSKVETAYAPNAGQALRDRAKIIEGDLKEQSIAWVRRAVRLDVADNSIAFEGTSEQHGDAQLGDCVDIIDQLQALPEVAHAISRDLQAAILQLWTTSANFGKWPRSSKDSTQFQLLPETTHGLAAEALQDVGYLFSIISDHLPQRLRVAVSGIVMSRFIEQLEDKVLTPSIPLEVDQVGVLEALLAAVQRLKDTLATKGWGGDDKLQLWIEGAPRIWLSRQREHTLSSVRQTLGPKLRRLQQVDKLESKPSNGYLVSSTSGEEASRSAAANAAQNDDDDSSAWNEVEQEDPQASRADVDDAAWGWEDENPPGEPRTGSPRKVRADVSFAKQDNSPHELYIVTGAPEAFMEACEEPLLKSQAMSSDQFADSIVSSAVAALSGIPILAAALYRAMAVTAYDEVENGKLLLYNDATRIAELLTQRILNGTAQKRSLHIGEPAKRKLRQEVEAFQRFAELAYNAELESQKTVLRDLMDGAQAFTNCTTSPFAEECDSAVEMTVDRVGRVHGQWQEILPRSVLLEATGSLLSAVVSKFLIDVQELADIGEEESKKLLGFCQQISSLSSLFADDGNGESRDMTMMFCPNWLKLQYLGEVLDGSLADIKYLWIEGELSLEFEQDEVLDLIQALFADSEHRRKAVADIKASRK